MFETMYNEMRGLEEKKRDEKEQKEYEEKQQKKRDERKKQSKLDNIVTLKNIDLRVKKGELVIVIGKVGSGKSTLLSAMIGDLLPIPQK
jgi:ABC-type polysaccharide/polyol phosphate transport system ATPase subunit